MADRFATAKKAERLAAAGAVQTVAPEAWQVTSGLNVYTVRRHDHGYTCTCAHYQKRVFLPPTPCSHVGAVLVHSSQEVVPCS